MNSLNIHQERGLLGGEAFKKTTPERDEESQAHAPTLSNRNVIKSPYKTKRNYAIFLGCWSNHKTISITVWLKNNGETLEEEKARASSVCQDLISQMGNFRCHPKKSQRMKCQSLTKEYICLKQMYFKNGSTSIKKKKKNYTKAEMCVCLTHSTPGAQ